MGFLSNRWNAAKSEVFGMTPDSKFDALYQFCKKQGCLNSIAFSHVGMDEGEDIFYANFLYLDQNKNSILIPFTSEDIDQLQQDLDQIDPDTLEREKQIFWTKLIPQTDKALLNIGTYIGALEDKAKTKAAAVDQVMQAAAMTFA